MADLLRVYGDLLKPLQHEYASGYAKGQTFSGTARELGVSRQAVHEAVRAVQRQLRTYEAKLGLLKAGLGEDKPPTKKVATKPDRKNDDAQTLDAVAEIVWSSQTEKAKLKEIEKLLAKRMEEA